MPSLSVIIPTRNEGMYLPGMLDALNAQTSRPAEIIVADAGSHDDTVELARGAQVVRGGRPAVERNAGARITAGALLQFFDADVLPARDFLARAMDEFARAGYAVAGALQRRRAPPAKQPVRFPRGVSAL